MTVSKVCKSLAVAERFLNRLYDKYSYVRLLRSPLFSEDGLYVWEVHN